LNSSRISAKTTKVVTELVEVGERLAGEMGYSTAFDAGQMVGVVSVDGNDAQLFGDGKRQT